MVIHPGTARDILAEGKPMLLDYTDIGDMIWAIGLAFARIKEDVDTLSDTATALRDGQKVFPFADGENGARAADSVIRNFEDGRERLDRIHEILMNCDNMIAVLYHDSEVE